VNNGFGFWDRSRSVGYLGLQGCCSLSPILVADVIKQKIIGAVTDPHGLLSPAPVIDQSTKSLALSPDNTRLYMADGPEVAEIDTTTNEVTRVFPFLMVNDVGGG
jgi:hypothetical protein